MARSGKMKVEAYIKISEDEEILWYTLYEDGTVVWHLPQEESKKYKQIMMKHAGENMSLYLQQHPEAGLWGKTN